jgi:hypothetical protein
MSNRHERRKRERFVRGLRRVENEGQGVWDMRVIFPQTLPAIVSDAAAGKPGMAVLYDLVMQAASHVREARPPALCLLCDHAFTGDMPAAFVVVTARVDEPKGGITNGLCAHCAEPGGSDLLQRVAQSYKERVMGDLRVLPVPHAPGRA